MEEIHARSCCFSSPICSYRLRSWCHRWLACAGGDQRAFFGTVGEAAEVLLLPQPDGRYKLQVASEKSSWFLRCGGDGGVWVAQRDLDCRDEDVVFTLELDESGRVSLRGGSQTGYLSSDWHGRFYGGATKARKWEMFTLVEKSAENVPHISPWLVRAPVRVTLQTSARKYLCAARHVVSARAEAPCCCEEFLIDLIFSSFPAEKSGFAASKPSQNSKSLWQALLGRDEDEEGLPELVVEPARHCTIRTSDGSCLLSAEPDGNVFTTRFDRAQGREAFSIQLYPDSKISIQQAASDRRYFGVEFGHLVHRKRYRRACDLFNIQLASGSRVLLRSVHGGFVGADARIGIVSSEKKDSAQGIGTWQLRAHGDSLYTLTCLTTTTPSKRGADKYMFVDAFGRVNQSSDPAVHFPSPASLFEIKPVSTADILPGTICTSSDIVGFTIRTARKIHGKQRYMSAQPNGALSAVRLTPTRWELFQIIDIDAAAAAAAPGSFACTPAALNRDHLPAQYGPLFSTSTGRAAKIDIARGPSLRERSASEAAAMALLEGHAVPKKSSASLQDLCISQVCVHASAEMSMYDDAAPDCRRRACSDEELAELVSALCSLSRRHDLLPASVPPDLIDESAFGISDDLLARIWDTCRQRQVPKNSCKWMQSAFLPQTQAQGPRARNRSVGRSSVTEGWHCSSCNQGNVLPMDAGVNPAHHKYLEFQSRVYSRAIQSTGILWNIISLAGVSIMSTALFCQLKAAATRRSLSF